MTDDNELVAAGAVLMLLLMAHEQVKTLTSVNVVVDDDGKPTNQLDVSFKFLRSPYRVTVTRVAEGGMK